MALNDQRVSLFFRDTSLRSIGSIFSSVLAIIFLPLLGSLVGPEILGKQQLILTFSLFLSLLIGLKIDVIIPLQKDKNLALNLLKSSFIICTISLLIALLIFFFLKSFFQFPYSDQIIICSIITGYVLCFSLSSQQFLNARKRFFISGMSDTVQRLTFIIFSLLCIFFINNNELVIYSIFAGLLIKTIFNFLFFSKNDFNFLSGANLEQPIKTFKLNIRSSIGWTSSQIIMTLGGLVPVIFIENLYGFQQLGFYYLATTILFGPHSFLMRSFGDVFFQRLGDRKNSLKNLAKTWRYSTIIIFIFAGIFVLLVNLIPNHIYEQFLSNQKYNWNEFGLIFKTLSILVIFSAITVPFDRVPIAFGWDLYPPIWNITRTVTLIFIGLISMKQNLSFTVFVYYQVIASSIFYIIDYFVVAYLLNYKKRIQG